MNLDSVIRAINAMYSQHLRVAYTIVENPATKLANAVVLAQTWAARIQSDAALHGQVLWVASQSPADLSRITSMPKILKNDMHVVRGSIGDVKDEYGERYLLGNLPSAQSLFNDKVFEQHNDRLFFVQGEAGVRVPRSQWPYVRSFRYYRPSDLFNAQTERREARRVVKDADDDWAIMERVAKALNPTAYQSNQPFSSIF